jgi:succinoglycan biosynthesis transport protein ExoP
MNNDAQRQYELKRYEQNDLALSSYVEYLRDKDKDDPHLRDYLNVLLKRKPMILIFMTCVVVVTVLISLMTVPMYRATTVVRIENQSPNVLSFKGVEADSAGSDYYETEYQIFKSRNIATRVITGLNLDKNKNFIPPPDMISKIKGFVLNNTIGAFIRFLDSFRTSSSSPKKSESSGQNRNDQAANNGIPDYLINSFISRLEVNPVKNSELVKISFVSHIPEMSMQVANSIAQTFIAFDLESRVFAGTEAQQFLKDQIELVRQKMDASEKNLNEFAARNGIVFNGEKDSLSLKKLSDISGVLNSVTADRIQKEALYRELKESGGNNPIVLNNSFIESLKNHYSNVEAEYFSLLKTYTPEYPRMKSLKSQMDAIKNRITEEIQRIIVSAKSDYNASLKKEQNLTKAFNAQKSQVLAFQGSEATYEVLKREVDANHGLYNSLLQRLNEISVSASSKATNIQVLDKATLPKMPFKPDLSLNIILAILFGLSGGVGLAFLADYFDQSIKDTNDIERKVNLTILGVIPKVESTDVAIPSSDARLIRNKGEGSGSPVPMILEQAIPVAEAFRSIGAFISLSSSMKPPKTILITGPSERIGKTLVCMNIAKALLESMGKGVIIDADLRRPKLHSAFEMNNALGLSSFLSGNIDFKGAGNGLLRPSPVNGLSIITSGPVPPNPSELLISPRMQDLVFALQSLFEFVIIDSPPALGLSDTIFLSKIVDGTVFVVKAGETPLKALLEMKRVFRDINSRILGVIVNGVKKNDLKYGTYNYYHSAYYSSYFKNQ